MAELHAVTYEGVAGSLTGLRKEQPRSAISEKELAGSSNSTCGGKTVPPSANLNLVLNGFTVLFDNKYVIGAENRSF